MSRSKYLTLSVAVSIGLLTACGPKAPAGGDVPPIEVGVVVVSESTAAITSELPGRTSAFRKAEVRPQVSGIIQKRLFTEGAEVKAGTPLYQIDPAPFEAALTSAQAEQSRAEANYATAKARNARFQSLIASKAISQQDFDDVQAAFSQARANLEIGKAAVENARINLKYTKVLAPISGVIGKSSVTEGALVSAGQSQVLATIQQLDPIYVDVSQSVDEMLKLRRQMMSGKLSAPGETKVKLVLSDGSRYAQEGRLQFSEVGVSESTGTVVLRALFPNPDKLLLPGMFVRTELQDGVHAKAILIPQQGVTRDRSGGATTLVVNKENKVELRPIKTSTAVGDKWLVDEGLAVGDQVIVDGLQKAKPGATVKAVPAKIATKTGE
ncbi:efflux RND transporter periplasmic adaptor subunit [Cellvibrio sp.]|uniref:efflux RND transporter periplasmic adaptor subunit n=1 Tax=Cellvibrio sp. TaxID=1965322 RepID=UPI003964796E